MKKIILVCFAIFLFFEGYAQGNNFKVNLIPVGWGELRVGFERRITKNQAIQINYGYLIPRSIPNFIYDESEIEDYGGTVDIKNEVSGFSLSGEYKWYTSKKKEGLKGFYLAPYVKYNKYELETSAGFDYNITTPEFNDLTPEQKEVSTSNGVGYTLEVTGDFNGNVRQLGGGLMIGYQWIFGDVISLDFNFFGLGIDSYSANIDLSTQDIDVDYTRWQEEIEAELEDFIIVGDAIDVVAEEDRVRIKAPFILPNFRFSLSFGIAF